MTSEDGTRRDRRTAEDYPKGGERLERIRRAIRERHDPEFDFLEGGPLPWQPPLKDLAGTRVALVTTGGMHLATERPFTPEREQFGDTSFRWVPHGTRPRELERSAPYVDANYAARDPEVALPMRALERLHREGLVRRPASRHAVFCGGIVRPRPGIDESGQRLLAGLTGDGVAAAVLLPTCSLCVQTVSLLARALESGGLVTVTISMLPELSARVGAPRTLAVRFPFGAPCGEPGNHSLHRTVLSEALRMIVECERPGEIRPSRQIWRMGSPMSPDLDPNPG